MTMVGFANGVMLLAPSRKLECGCDAGYCPQLICTMLRDDESKPGADDAGASSDSDESTSAFVNSDPGDGVLACGCVGECCGVCVHANAAGRTRENVASFKYPNLNTLRGKKWRAHRDGVDGEPMMWYWQVKGERWGLDAKSFAVAIKAWKRFSATDEQRAGENEARYNRAVTPAWVKENEKKTAREKRQREEVQEAERARRWRELRRVLHPQRASSSGTQT